MPIQDLFGSAWQKCKSGGAISQPWPLVAGADRTIDFPIVPYCNRAYQSEAAAVWTFLTDSPSDHLQAVAVIAPILLSSRFDHWSAETGNGRSLAFGAPTAGSELALPILRK